MRIETNFSTCSTSWDVVPVASTIINVAKLYNIYVLGDQQQTLKDASRMRCFVAAVPVAGNAFVIASNIIHTIWSTIFGSSNTTPPAEPKTPPADTPPKPQTPPPAEPKTPPADTPPKPQTPPPADTPPKPQTPPPAEPKTPTSPAKPESDNGSSYSTATSSASASDAETDESAELTRENSVLANKTLEEQKNEDCALKAIIANPQEMKFAHNDLRGNAEFVKEAEKKAPGSLQYAGKKTQTAVKQLLEQEAAQATS